MSKKMDLSGFSEVTVHYAGSTKPSGEAVMTVVNSTCDRVTFSVKSLKSALDCADGDRMKILMSDNAVILQKDENGAVELRAKGHKYLVYSKVIVDLLTETLGLDFNGRTSCSAYRYELMEVSGIPAIYIKAEDFI